MAEKHVEHGARAAYASWRERLGSATTWNELAPAAQITWLNVARAVLDSQQPKDDRPVWGHGEEAPVKPCDSTCRHGGQRPVIPAPKASAVLPRPLPAPTKEQER